MRKNVFITGANKGIGFELARLHVQAGWNVIATYRDASTAQALIDLLGANHTLQLDVKDEAAIAKLPDMLGSKVENLSRLINNAGVFGPRTSFDDLSADNWLETLHVNTIAPTQIAVNLTGMLAKGAEESRLSQVVNISSRMGSVSTALDAGAAESPIYRSSKSALNMAMALMSAKVKGLSIGVYVLHPGWVQTSMGGENADLTVEKSTADLFETMNARSLSDTGGFFNHDGTRISY